MACCGGNYKCDHEENRRKVCAPCGKKIVIGKKKLEFFLINTNLEKLIKEFINEDFDVSNSKFPLSVCTSCRLSLSDRTNNCFKRPLQTMPNYTDMFLPKETRTKCEVCNCYICLTARYKGHLKVKKGRGHVRHIDTVINTSNGLYGASSVKQLHTVEISKSKEINMIKLCKNCFQEVGKDKTHTCGGTQIIHKNLIEVIDRVPDQIQDKVVKSVIQRKVEASNGNIEKQKQKRNLEITLNTYGANKTKIVVNPDQKRNISFPADKLDNYQNSMNLSSNQMRKLTNFIKCYAGKNSVPNNYTKPVSDKSKIL